MWGLIFGVCIAAIAIGLRVEGKVGDKGLGALLTFAIASGVAIAYFGQTREVEVGPFKLKTFREEADKFTKEKLAEIDKEFVVHREAISSLIDKADKSRKELDVQKKEMSSIIKMAHKTREDLLSVAEAVAPPYLSFESRQVERTEEGYKVNLRFNPSKNEPFGTIVFRADIIVDSEAIIKQLTCEGMHFSGKEQVSTDGKTAIKQYASPGVRQQKIILTVSAPCKVRISGSHMREKLEFEVK